MTMAADLIVDRIPRVEGTQEPLASWYTQGLSDGLGDRLLMFDNTNAPSWELLRFRPELVSGLAFESALRERVEQLSHFRHPLFTQVRAVEELGFGDGLALVSTYAPGRRLSEALSRPRSATAVIPLIRQLTGALAALQEQGEDIAHGALTADRIMVTREGRLIVREHVIGSALARLRLSAPRLWTDLGIIAGPTSLAVPTLDRRADVVQLALIALALMLGRRVGPADYPRRIDELLDRIGDTTESDRFPAFRFWLERALQLSGRLFDCAEDARQALSDLTEDGEGTDEALTWQAAPLRQRPAARGEDETGSSVTVHDPIEQFTSEAASTSVPDQSLEPPPSLIRPPAPLETSAGDGGRQQAARLVAAAAILIALGEAVIIGRLLSMRGQTPPTVNSAVVVDFGRPGADVLVDGQRAGVTPLALKVGPHTHSIRVVSHEPDPAAPDVSVVRKDLDPRPTPPTVDARPADNLRIPVRPQQSSGLRIASPFELQVFEGDRLLGSSAGGQLVVAPGRHDLDLINGPLGYRVRRTVDIKPGQIVSVTVTPPKGNVSINALPWAEVWLDGAALGQTPLGNVSVALGEHEIVFRHPDLGERREKAIVRSDRLTLVSANLQR